MTTVEQLAAKAGPWTAQNRNSLVGILLLAVGGLVWSNNETFLWRDDWLYLQFFLADGPSSCVDNFASDVKPLFQYILFAEFSSFGTTFEYYQVINVILLTICSIAMYQLLIAYEVPGLFALLVSLLYLVHPTNFVNAFWISGQCELIHIALVLFSFLAYRKYTASPNIASLTVFAICIFLQNLFFANGIFYPLMFLFLELLRGRRNWNKRLISIAGLIFVLNVTFAFFITQRSQTSDSVGLLANFPEKILFFFSFTANSITRLIVPNAPHAPGDIPQWLGLTVLMGTIAWTLYRRRQSDLLLVSIVALLSASIMLSLFRSSTTVMPYYYTSLQVPFLILMSASLYQSIVKDINMGILTLLLILILVGFGYGDRKAKRVFAHRNLANRQKLEQAIRSGHSYEPADDPALALPGYISINGKSSGESAVILFKQLSLRDH